MCGWRDTKVCSLLLLLGSPGTCCLSSSSCLSSLPFLGLRVDPSPTPSKPGTPGGESPPACAAEQSCPRRLPCSCLHLCQQLHYYSALPRRHGGPRTLIGSAPWLPEQAICIVALALSPLTSQGTGLALSIPKSELPDVAGSIPLGSYSERREGLR